MRWRPPPLQRRTAAQHSGSTPSAQTSAARRCCGRMVALRLEFRSPRANWREEHSQRQHAQRADECSAPVLRLNVLPLP